MRGNGSTALGEGRPPPATRPTSTAYWQVGRYSTHLQEEGHVPRTLYSGGSALSYSARPLTTDSLIAVLACQYFQADSTSPNLVWRVPRCRLLSTGGRARLPASKCCRPRAGAAVVKARPANWQGQTRPLSSVTCFTIGVRNRPWMSLPFFLPALTAFGGPKNMCSFAYYLVLSKLKA